MKKSYLLVFLLTPFCIWAVAGASDRPKKAPNPAKSGAEQQILADENLIASGLAERPDGDLILWEECPLGYTIFGQIPRSSFDQLFNGFDSDLATGVTHFENFWGLPEDICRVTWWGFDLYHDDEYYLQECIEDPMDFEVAFYPDDGSGMPDTLNPIYTLPSVTPTRTPTGQLYGPYGDLWIELNRYELVLDPCISATEGWISIQGISYGGDPQDCVFYWINSPQGDGSHWKLSAEGWSQFLEDQAFCLGGADYSPTYGACCNLSTGDCQDNVEYQNCPQGARFEADVLCEDLDPRCRATVFCEDFIYSLGMFTSYEAGDPAGWQWVYNRGNPVGSAFHADDNVQYGCDDWLISPGGYTVADGDTLMWDQRDNYSDYITYHGVLISSDYVSGDDPTTATWRELYTGAAPEDAWETQSVDLSSFAGETVHIAFRYRGDFSDQWWVDNVCVFGFGVVGPTCDYLPGDCDHNGTALELGDVIAMISMYRGAVDPPYECDCPPNGANFTPTTDPNGNCTPNQLADVVLEIAAYRGSVIAYGCVDCPGDGPPPPGASGLPPLKSKVKVSKGANAE